ncbi:hypothetical protein [Legionella waltersii]|uniref:Transmembrane protein n=1 Tax=Legionella waltersii TaxID=66969 RepID=A0A0W1A5J4_9GAMM|nr:hypothetical protein [Legionella waltersii]KTD76606.1 hypothetical protein Lwal_2328 [Legionella waltersii]SNU94608.1 Uncharacterised protein [Legionella waltersii]
MMEEISRFRGMSGEVVRGFLKINSFLTIIPVVLFWLLLLFLLSFVDKRMPGFVSTFIILAASSLFVARFAIPASQGNLHAGLFNPESNGETLGFMGRYCIYTLIWMVPATFLENYLLESNSLAHLIFSTSFSFSAATFDDLLYALLVLVSVFAPTLCYILATTTSSITDLFSFEPIQWLLQDRRQDLGTYYASIIGGLVIFYIKYLVPLLIINQIAYKISVPFGLKFSLFIYMLPFFASPILIGRLTGGFIAGESTLDEDVTTETNKIISQVIHGANNQSTNTDASPSPGDLASLVKSKKGFEQLLNTIDELSPEEITQNILEAEKAGNNIYTLLQLSFLYKKANRKQEALVKASVAINKCLSDGMGFEALQLFKYFSKDRSQLQLQSQQLQILASHLIKHKLYMDAAWCYMLVLAEELSLDEQLGVHKKFVSLATEANQNNEPEIALNLYQLFLQRYPESTLVDFVKSAMQGIKEKQQKS